MGTTAEKLTYLNETKTQLKDMLNLGGASLTTEPFRQYVDTLKNRYLYFINNGTQEVWDNWDKVTGEGTIITLDNTEEAPMKIVLKGNTSQEGTPTPEAPQDIHVVSGENTINVCGKNLFDKDNANMLSLNSGTSQGTEATYRSATNQKHVYIKCEPNTTYTITKGTNVNTVLGINEAYGIPAVGVSYKVLYFSSTSSGIRTITTGENAQYLDLRINNDSTSEDDIQKILDTIQIEKDTQATEYEAYKGASYPINLGDIELCKIGDYQDSIKKSTGKNLFENVVYKNNYIIASNGTETGNALGCIWEKIKVKPNTTYTLSYSSTDYSFAQRVSEYNSSDTFIQRSTTQTSPYTFTTTSTTEYINLSGLKTDTKIMINEGTTALDYEPYGTSWYLNKQIGKYTNPEWHKGSSANVDVFYSTSINNYATSNNIPLSNNFIGVANVRSEQNMRNQIGKIAFRDSQEYIRLYVSSELTETELNNLNTIVYYVLDTPTYTEITDSTLISQLNALAKSYASQTNISQESNDLASILNATALREMS